MESSKLPSDTDPRDYATIDTFESTSEKTKVLTNSVRDLLEVKSTKEVSGTAVVRKFFVFFIFLSLYCSQAHLIS